MNDVEPDNTPGWKIGDLVAAFRKHVWLIAGMLVVVPLIVGFVVSRQPKIYETSASLVIDNVVPQYLGSQFKDVVELESNWWTAMETMQTELRVIRSFSQAKATAEALCDPRTIAQAMHQDDFLNEPPVLPRLVPNVACGSPKSFEVAAPVIQGLITVTPVRDSRVVVLSVRHSDPKLTAIIANVMAHVYAQRNLDRRTQQSQGAASWLGEEYGDLVAQLREAENSLIEFKKKHGVLAVNIEDQQNDLSNRHKKLSEELNNVQVKLIALRAQREQYERLKSDDPLLEVAPGVAEVGTIQKLKELYIDQYTKLVELRGRYLERHPAILSQEARVASIRADLQREAQLAHRRTEAQFQALVKEEKDLRSALDSATRDALALEQRAIEYRRLKRNFDRLSKLSEQVGGRERETAVAGHLKTNNVRVLDLALVPTSHISPNLKASVAGGAIVGLVLGLALALFLEFLDGTVKSQEDVERLAGVTVLGIVPAITDDKTPHAAAPPALAAAARSRPKDLHILLYPRSAVAECCRAIRTNLLFMRPDKPAKTMVVTSPGPEEGKTTTAINIAITLAQSGLRVLIVDTDLRRPRLHKAFGVPNTTDGVSKAIVGEAEVMDMVRETGVPNLYILPCGAIPPNPSELLHANRTKALIAELADRFDRVIFDSPPVGAVTDAAILSKLTDGTLLVARSGVTSKDAVVRARRSLVKAGATLLGCVINAIDLGSPGTAGYYRYYAKYGYYGGYGSDEQSPEASSSESKA
jgi:capsular exopolysaccharide synthesis family protein